MLKYLTKFVVDIFPSVAATVIGAYIVNHYIVAKPEAPAAAAVSTAQPKAAVASKPVEKPAEVSNLPEAGVKAKGMSERTLMERTASEKATVIEKPAEKATENKPAAEAPAETASIPPAEPRRHQPAPREKAVAKVTPAPVQQPATVPAAAPASPPAEAAAVPDEHRDANDLARAAIERLRGTAEGGSRSPEAARAPEAPRVATAPSVVRPLPPPIMVSTPPSETFGQTSQPRPPYAASAADDPNRPTPPADIPTSRPPLDLRADAAGAEPAKERPTIGDDMLSSMKSVFHAVLPK
ncbi:hypothetical protein [Bradyrhizobium sp. Leo121]|uniref:hypothetical protein n=1 Tax=Bradyrhizobium sp. Leo121 TaxID=1571195 RepID=UPI001029A399|nr:hypothetical protein [Bradyrhizobium sp. Leo121]RZN28825.1 hypothetical protein CWO90_23115 [Bradyrhizobium sp. Leo121]